MDTIKSPHSLDAFKAQISEALRVYEGSVRAWTVRRNVYEDLLKDWTEFGQIRENPVDSLRLEFISNEIAKQRKKLDSCRASLEKFELLEMQMKQLASAVPDPTTRELDLANDETLMEIREELDDDDNVISSTVSPHNAAEFKAITDTIQSPGPSVEAQSLNSIVPGCEHSPVAALNSIVPGCEHSPVADNRVSTCSGFVKDDRHVHDIIDDHEQNEYGKNSAESQRAKRLNGHATELVPQVPKIEELSSGIDHELGGNSDSDAKKMVPHRADGLFNIRETADGSLEITDDPDGSTVGILPQGLAEMTDIVNEMDWENIAGDDDEDDESEDEFGRTKHFGLIPLPGQLSRPVSSQETRSHIVEHNRRHSADRAALPITSARREKKKLVFANDLVQGPSKSAQNSSPKSVLKKGTAYPINDGFDSESPPPTPIIAEPKKSRFRLERSSTDTKIADRHARPSQTYQDKLDQPVAMSVVERGQSVENNDERTDEPQITKVPDEALAAKESEERDQLFPNKVNLASVDLSPSDGTVKAKMVIPRLSDEQMQAIKKKREMLGKKHKRRKSADPHYPVRSGSWDDTQPVQKPHRRPSTGEDEMLAETLKAARLSRAKEILGAQDDIAWANAPISPDDVRKDQPNAEANPLAQAGKEIEEHENVPKISSPQTTIATDVTEPRHTTARESNTEVSRPSSQIAPRVLSPKPRKPPTPERRSSTNIPSPLSQEVQPYSASREVQFTADVIKRLEPLMETDIEPEKSKSERKQKKKPLRQPIRQSSVDPQVISPTPGSPPPDNRHWGPLGTEAQGAIRHHMVRATNKSPPPHIAIHDLETDTSEFVRQAMKEEALTQAAEAGHSSSEEAEVNPRPTINSVWQSDILETVLDSNSPPVPVLDNVVERSPDWDTDQRVPNIEDDLDDEMHRKEIVQQYHKLRARLIGSQGGFLKEAAGEIVPLDDDDLGPGNRVSRFKAARLGQSS